MRLYLVLGALLLAICAGVTARAAPVPSVVRTDQSLLVASSTAGNAYVLGGTVVATAPVGGDLTAVAGSIDDAAPVAGDALLLGGTASVRAAVAGDVRLVAGSAHVEKEVGGDLAALGFSVADTAPVAGSVEVAAATVTLEGGAGGDVTVYGNTVTLGGAYGGNVRVVAGDRLTLLPDTHIKGTLSYEAPVPATIPESATSSGGVIFTAASYLPGTSVSRSLSVASIGIFLFARILASMILAGLLAGLFPVLAEHVVAEAYVPRRRSRHIVLTTLLGFAAAVATPILTLLLALTLVGLGLALLLGLAYILVGLLSLVYAGIALGGCIARLAFGRAHVKWSDGVLGTLILSLVGLMPIIGFPILFISACFAGGALLLIFFRFAFKSDEETSPLL